MRTGRLVLLVGFLFLAAGALSAQKVSVDYNHNLSFAKYHTYTWLKPVQAPGLWAQRLTDGVNSQITSKGLSPDPNNPDVEVAAFGASETMHDLNTFYSGTGGWGYRGMGTATATTTTTTYQKGTVVVDMFDARTKQLIWRGVASDTASGNPEKNEKKLQKALEKMFKEFPPKEPGMNK